jgi:hypothetical protein
MFVIRLAVSCCTAVGQWAGLVKSCVALPELNNCSRLVDTAFAELESWLDREVYPDGMETEEAFGYDMWTARSFFNTIEMLQQAKHPPPPQSYLNKVETMFNYGVNSDDQLQYSPRDGDMDLSRSGWYQPAMDYFKRSDWLYVHTAGANGTKPPGESASVMFPWGGQAILRNTFEQADAHWLWMDVGNAYGSSGHAHASKNAINLRAYGDMLLVDSGRFQYNGAGLSEQLNREYERTTTAHNTLTFDSCQQAYQPAVAKAPVANSSWNFGATMDFVSGQSSLYNGLEGFVTHQRGVLYVKLSNASLPSYIVVVDKVTTDRSRTVQASWHAHPNSVVEFVGDVDSRMATVQGVETGGAAHLTETMVVIIPSTSASPSVGENAGSDNIFDWENASIVRGQKGNASLGLPWQGWYSSNYNGNSTAPTLVYDGRIPETGATLGWLLIPQKHKSSSSALAASLQIKSTSVNGLVTATVSIAGKSETVSLPLGRAPAPPPPCASNEARVCGECKALSPSLSCPKGQRVDFYVASGNDGSCPCDQYCATDWNNQAKRTRPHWKGATSAFGTNSSAFKCPGTDPLVCVCVQASHFCPKIQHLCKEGCDAPGLPVAKDNCVPA